jgi:hypothetical protein
LIRRSARLIIRHLIDCGGEKLGTLDTDITLHMNEKVFISYSHDSGEHRARILALSERLRADGIVTILDRYAAKGSPPEGWPRWMLNGLNEAGYILCVCTETYYRRFLGREVPEKGKGADWEGSLISQALYDARSHSNKFIPVLFDRSDEAHIPEPLRDPLRPRLRGWLSSALRRVARPIWHSAGSGGQTEA